MSEFNKALEIQRLQLSESEDPGLDETLELTGINKLIIQNLIHAGFETYKKLLLANIDEIAQVPGISVDMAYKILEEVSKCPWQKK